VSEPVSHRYVVHISDTGLLAPTRARSATDLGSDGRVIPPSPTSTPGAADGRGSPATGARRSSHQYRFECELGDVWTELTTPTLSGAALALASSHRVPRRATATASTASSSANTVCQPRCYTERYKLWECGPLLPPTLSNFNGLFKFFYRWMRVIDTLDIYATLSPCEVWLPNLFMVTKDDS